MISFSFFLFSIYILSMFWFQLKVSHCDGLGKCLRSMQTCSRGIKLKGNSHQKLSAANVIELLLKSFLVYHSPMFEAWKAPQKAGWSVVWCHAALGGVPNCRRNSDKWFRNAYTYRTTLAAALHAYTIFAWLIVQSVQKSYWNWRRHSALTLYKGNFASSFRRVLLPQSH